MKKRIIYKGFHRSLPYKFPILKRWKKNRITWSGTFVFDSPTCAYNLGNEDQGDWNKLGGICFGILGVHKDCFRFVWRYNLKTRKMEIAAGMYCNGARTFNRITAINLGEEMTYTLELTRSGKEIEINFTCSNGKSYNTKYEITRKPWLNFGIGLYFGGNQKAPQKMIILEK